jgi:hypothetical protein
MHQLFPSFRVEINAIQQFHFWEVDAFLLPWYAICILHHIWFQSILFLKGIANKVENQLLVNLSLTHADRKSKRIAPRRPSSPSPWSHAVRPLPARTARGRGCCPTSVCKQVRDAVTACSASGCSQLPPQRHRIARVRSRARFNRTAPARPNPSHPNPSHAREKIRVTYGPHSLVTPAHPR